MSAANVQRRQIDQLWRYPVKSMRGELVESAEVNSLGIVGDRTWATRDEVRGGIRGAKKLKGLMEFSARYTGKGFDVVEITGPDGSIIETTDPERDRKLSRALGHDVTLWPLQPPGDTEHYRRGRPDADDYETELRTIFARDDDEPLPDFAGFPALLEHFESPPGTYYDVHPLMIMTTSAFAAMRGALPSSVIDVARFRPSMVIETPGAEGHPELDWIGSRMIVGDVSIDVVGPCPRCVMITHAINDDIPQDRTILRHVVRDLGQNVGVYGTVAGTGTVRVGDAVRILG